MLIPVNFEQKVVNIIKNISILDPRTSGIGIQNRKSGHGTRRPFSKSTNWPAVAAERDVSANAARASHKTHTNTYCGT